MQIRRGYQAQITEFGGLGNGTFKNDTDDSVQTVTVDFSGQLYNKLDQQLYFYYDGQVSGAITGITNANPGVIHAVNHGLINGTIVYLEGINGTYTLNNKTFTISVVDGDHFSIGIDTTNTILFPPYISGGTWVIAFTLYRYLTFTIFTDPRFLNTNPGWSFALWRIDPWGSDTNESITCNITVNRAAVTVGVNSNTNTFNVQFGHEIASGSVIQFYDSSDTFQQRTVTSTTTTSITFNGNPSTIVSGSYINKFYDIKFGRGFDIFSAFLISDFLAVITDPVLGIHGLDVEATGFINYPAAFLQIIEPITIDSNMIFIIDYWYWELVNHTVPIPFAMLSLQSVQNSQQFENASMASFHDVIYIADGYDFPQKYDGQTVYRAGMPEGERPVVSEVTTGSPVPFTTGQVYTYAITYEQFDVRGNFIEGVISDPRVYTVVAASAALTVTIDNIPAGSGWNTNGAVAVGGASTTYGPDNNGFYYTAVSVYPNYTLKFGDDAFYTDTTIAVISGVNTSTNIINLNAGHNLIAGIQVKFTSGGVLYNRNLDAVTPTSMTIDGPAISVTGPINVSANFINNRSDNTVYGHLAIVNGNQNNVNTINVITGTPDVAAVPTLVIGDMVYFTDTSEMLQFRTVTNVTGTTVTIDGRPVSIIDGMLIYSKTLSPSSLNLQRINFGDATLAANAPISNNLRINLYRSVAGGTDLYLDAVFPNDSIGSSTFTYTDRLADASPDPGELGFRFEEPIFPHDPPPISKYVLVFNNIMLYGGGQVNVPFNSDNVFFSNGNAPEAVPASSSFFSVPSVDDIVTGMGVSGTSLIIGKGQSIWSIVGDLLGNEYEVTQVCPGANIGFAAHATVKSVGSMLYFLHTNGVYAMTENQIFPTDKDGNPIPLSTPIDKIFRETNFIPTTRYVLRRAVAVNYTKENQYLLFLPCEDPSSAIRTANNNSIILCYDYQGKNWYEWDNMNGAGGMFVIKDDLYFQERRFSNFDGNNAALYKQHRFYRLVDHADHAGAQRVEWRSSWTDLGFPEVRKKFNRCVLLMDRISNLFQFNNVQMEFSSYVDRIPNLQNTISQVTTIDNIRNSSWSYSGWGWNFWSGYQDSFVRINLKRGTVSKSIQIGFTITGINMDMRFSGFQLEAVPENRRTIVR